MRPLPRRLPSRSAIWALRVSIFVPILALASILAHLSGRLNTPDFLVLLAVIAVFALFALLLVLIAFRSLWVHGKRGGRRASWALFLCALVLSPYAYCAGLWVTRPKVVEVSTDLVVPPVFRSEVIKSGKNAATVAAGELVDAYTDITGRRYNSSVDMVFNEVLRMGEERGWRVVSQRGRIGADSDLTIEFSDKSLILALPQKISFRIKDEGETSYLDLRAKTPFIAHDLGANAYLVREFLSEIDYNLIGQVQN